MRQVQGAGAMGPVGQLQQRVQAYLAALCAVNFGQLAVEFLALSLDPYPRKPGAVFEGAGDAAPAKESPFAALEALKNKL